MKWIILAFVIMCVMGEFITLWQRATISRNMNSDPVLAVKTVEKYLESNSIDLDEYEKYLIKIAERTECIAAMVKLIELYAGEKTGKKGKSKKIDTKCTFWKKAAAKAGDIKSIIDYYGLSDYDVGNDSYDEIICDLEKARVTSEAEKTVVRYYLGLLYYKVGQIDVAKEIFASLSDYNDHVVANPSKYMLFKCFIEEKNTDEAEKILDELLAKEFEVPAADYLSLFHYYNGEMGATKTDYVKALACASRYANAKDADHKTANAILGNTFYQIAIACQNGSNGFEKDLRQCIISYKCAAEYGNVDAMGYFGMCLWTGSHDNMGIHRNYYQANKYILKAAQGGHKKSEEILAQYGVDGVLVLPMRAESITYQFMDGYQLTASLENMKWVQLYAGISYKVFQISDEFMIIYHNTFKTFDGLINGIYEVYAEQVAKMLRWGVQLLMFFNIDMYSENEILDECDDLSLLPRVPRFEHRLETIDSRAEELNLKTAYAQASRGRWSGTGFGTTIRSTINASIQASVAAGVMNIGGDILHGIGDSIVKSINNSEIKNMGKKLFEDPTTFKEFNNALLSACFDVGCVIRKIIVKHCGIALSELDGKIKFGSEELANIDEKTLNAKIINNLTAKKIEYTYALVIEKLRRFPTDSETLEQLFMLTLYRISSLEADSMEIDTLDRYAGDADLDLGEFKNKIMDQLRKDRPELFTET